MLSKENEQRLNSYLGFALRKKAIYVGLKMEEMIVKRKANYLILLPSCTEKKEEHFLKLKEKNSSLTIFRYQGNFEIKEILGYELLNAFVVTDDHLAKAIISTLQDDK